MAITPKDLLLVLCFTFIWGFNFVVVRLGLDSFPPLFFLALRFLLAAIPAIFFVSRSGIPIRLIFCIGIVLGTLHYSALYLGIAFGVSPGVAALIVQVHIILTLIFSFIALGERPSANQILGVVTSFLGLSVLIWSRFESVGIVALGAVLLAAAFLAVSNLMMRAARVKNTLGLTVWSSLIPPVPLVVISLVIEQGQLERLMSLSWHGMGALLYGSFFGTLLATAVVAKLLTRYSANVVAPFYLLVPIFAMASSALVLSERPATVEFLSSAVMLAGLLIVVRTGGSTRNPPAASGSTMEPKA
jgi:O-acetylserine/cysteine efflux transporter